MFEVSFILYKEKKKKKNKRIDNEILNHFN